MKTFNFITLLLVFFLVFSCRQYTEQEIVEDETPVLTTEDLLSRKADSATIKTPMSNDSLAPANPVVEPTDPLIPPKK